MKLTFVSIVVCLVLFSGKAQGALNVCPTLGSCPANANCPAANQPCVCNDGFHEVTNANGPSTCAQDIGPGGSCNTAGTDTDCVDGATCKNTVEAGQIAVLECTCNDNFHEKTQGSGKICEADIQPDAECTVKDSTTECVDSATCLDTAESGQPEVLKCKCNTGFHISSGTCQADIQAGNACTLKDSAVECVAEATCTNVATDGQPDDLQCTCNADFYPSSGVCTPKKAIGAACLIENSGVECKAYNSKCTNMAPSDQATVLQCQCNSGYHTSGDGCQQDKAVGAECLIKNSAECGPNAQCANVAAAGEPEQLKCQCKDGDHERTAEDGTKTCHTDIVLGAECFVENSDLECADDKAKCLNSAAAGQPQALKCTCDSGSHQLTGSLVCTDDIKPGTACTLVDNALECVDSAKCVDTASTGQAQNLQCTCSAGYHVMSEACQADKTPGSTCFIKNSQECVSNAACQNTAEASQAEVLQCVCLEGHHPAGDPAACVADKALGAACTMENQATECADTHAKCMNVAEDGETQDLQCTCNAGFHSTTGDSPVCEADKGAGSTCNTVDSNECVPNAACQDTSPPSDNTQVLQCVCVSGHHQKPVEGAATMCEEDISPGQTCTQADVTTECVSDATCKNTDSGLKCMCNVDFHTAEVQGKQACAADTCQHTRDKCAAAGMTTCEDHNNFIGCMLRGVCNPGDSEQLTVFKTAMETVMATLPDDCAVATTDTCKNSATACVNVFLRADTDCLSAPAFAACLQGTNTLCTTTDDRKIYNMANAYMTTLFTEKSCLCVTTLENCKTGAISDYDAENADTTAKCNAVKALFTCALTDTCDLTKTIDHQEVSSVWSMAMSRASETECAATLTESAANTCPLQLTRCSLLYGEAMKGADNKSAECSAAEDLGDCLTDDTSACADAHSAQKKLFTDQFNAISQTCACYNHLKGCRDDVGVLPSDSAAVCPKLMNYGLCTMGAKCDLSEQDSGLGEAHAWYKDTKTTHNCQVTSDNSCSSSVSMCVNNFIGNITMTGISAARMCEITSDSVLCMNAANCSSDVDDDVTLMTSYRAGASFRLQSLSCQESSCNKTNEMLTECTETYNGELAAANTNTNKCDAKNKMVRCLRNFLCNKYMTDLVESKHEALKTPTVSGCSLLPLREVSGAATPTLTIATLLTALMITFASI